MKKWRCDYFAKISTIGLLLGLSMAAVKNNGCSDGELVRIVKATSITINPTEEVTVKVGNATTLTATVFPANATYKNVTWRSLDTEIATVNLHTGVVTGVSMGTATIVRLIFAFTTTVFALLKRLLINAGKAGYRLSCCIFKD